jgi:hypothetical protein
MTDRTEVGNKLKESLKGWEFTPAMQQRVLERIRALPPETRIAEEPEQPAGKVLAMPRRRLPLAFLTVGAAAAALLIGINLTRFQGPASFQAPRAAEESSRIAAPAAPMPAPMQTQAHDAAGGAAGAVPPAAQQGESLAVAAMPAEKMMPAIVHVLASPAEAGRLEMLVAAPLPATLPLEAGRPTLLAGGEGAGFAVATGLRVQLFDGTGRPTTSYPVAGNRVTAIAYASDTVSAAGVDGRLVQVLGSVSYTVPGQHFAIRTDGLLGVADGTTLTLYRPGRQAWQLSLPGDPPGLTIAGDVLVAGQAAHDIRTGALLWTHADSGLPSAAGPDLLVRHDGPAVRAYRASDGAALWAVSLTDGHLRAVAGGGGRVALLSGDGKTASLWVLDADGRMLYARSFGQPVDSVAVTGEGRVLLLLGDGSVAALPMGDFGS